MKGASPMAQHPTFFHHRQICPLCQNLPPNSNSLCQSCPQENIPQGKEICRENHKLHHLIFICQGEVEVKKHFQNTPFSITTLGPGSILGEVEMWTNLTSSATVIAKKDCKIHKMSYHFFQQKLQEQHPTALNIFFEMVHLLAHRLKSMNEKIISLLHTSQKGKYEEFAHFKQQLLQNWDF
ncbi:MAG: cyclic nucleotide-binding domain-containing protein [Planctomycetota bacterium]|nr:MAG: cyclic nucleotide-binding domain-containing protein [Planctomycetota bacterium]